MSWPHPGSSSTGGTPNIARDASPVPCSGSRSSRRHLMAVRCRGVPQPEGTRPLPEGPGFRCDGEQLRVRNACRPWCSRRPCSGEKSLGGPRNRGCHCSLEVGQRSPGYLGIIPMTLTASADAANAFLTPWLHPIRGIESLNVGRSWALRRSHSTSNWRSSAGSQSSVAVDNEWRSRGRILVIHDFDLVALTQLQDLRYVADSSSWARSGGCVGDVATDPPGPAGGAGGRCRCAGLHR
jgi:hypothetical protein